MWGSNRKDGRHEIYLMKADGSGISRLTHAGGMAPSWSHDGRWIAYNHAPDESVHVIRWNGTGDKQVCPQIIKQTNGGQLPPFWLHDKSGILCATGGDYYVVHPDTGANQPLFKYSDFTQLAGAGFMPSSMTHDGRWVLSATDRYRNGYEGTNGYFKAFWAAVILDRQAPDKLYFFGLGCEPMTPPWGDSLYHVCGGGGFCPHGYDIAKMNIQDVGNRSSYTSEVANADVDWGHEYFPRISNDNKWLSYGASLGCHDHDICDYEIFIHPLGSASSERIRLTTDSNNDRWPHLYLGALWKPPAPKLALSPTNMTFSAQQGAIDPADQGLTISNAGPGDLDPVTTDVVYGAGSGWLTITPAGSLNNQSLNNSVSLNGLSPNTYTATVAVVSAGASNSPQSYTVSLTVTPQSIVTDNPAILLKPASLDFTSIMGGPDPAPRSVTVENSGVGTLGAVSPSVSYPSGPADWLTVTPAGSDNSQLLQNSVRLDGLSPNTYSATVAVISAGAVNSPQNYTVSLTVTSLIPGDGGSADGGTTPAAADGGVGVLDSGAAPVRKEQLLGGCSASGPVQAPTPCFLLMLILGLRMLSSARRQLVPQSTAALRPLMRGQATRAWPRCFGSCLLMSRSPGGLLAYRIILLCFPELADRVMFSITGVNRGSGNPGELGVWPGHQGGRGVRVYDEGLEQGAVPEEVRVEINRIKRGFDGQLGHLSGEDL